MKTQCGYIVPFWWNLLWVLCSTSSISFSGQSLLLHNVIRWVKNVNTFLQKLWDTLHHENLKIQKFSSRVMIISKYESCHLSKADGINHLEGNQSSVFKAISYRCSKTFTDEGCCSGFRLISVQQVIKPCLLHFRLFKAYRLHVSGCSSTSACQGLFLILSRICHFS